MLRRLLSLDYVLEHPQTAWLPNEDEKVNALTAAGIAKDVLPRRLYRGAVGAQYPYFPHKLPAALDGVRATSLLVRAEDETESAVRTVGRPARFAVGGARHGRPCRRGSRRGPRDPVRLAAAARVLDKWAATPPESVAMAHDEAPAELAAIKKAIAMSDRDALDSGLNPAIQRACALGAACAGSHGRRSRAGGRGARSGCRSGFPAAPRRLPDETDHACNRRVKPLTGGSSACGPAR